MKKIYVFALMLLVVLVAAPSAQAGQWYAGGGLNTVSLGDDLDDVDSGQGITLNFGYYFQPSFALDFVLGFSGHDEPFGDDITYSRFDIGALFAFGTPEGISPYLGVGFGSHSMDYDDFADSFTGTSLFLTGGFDYYITPGHSVDFGLRVHAWDIDVESGSVIFTDVGDATTTVISVMYNYHFLMM